ncbi:MAG: FKBP-type peptidyl-prolyl cis-trans isomerase [Candidatus Aenigmatarchaeota archaeon]
MKDGDFVEIEYVGRLKDTNEIFDLTDEELAKKEGIFSEKVKDGPVRVVLGEGLVLKGLEEIVKAMKPGEEKTELLTPEKAFGERKADLVKVVPEAELRRQKINPYPGMILDMGEVKAKIQSVNSGRVRLDFNNPLASRDVEYKVKVNRLIEDKAEKAAALVEFFFRDAAEAKIDGEKVKIKQTSPLSEQAMQKVAELLKKHLNAEKVIFKREF